MANYNSIYKTESDEKVAKQAVRCMAMLMAVSAGEIWNDCTGSKQKIREMEENHPTPMYMTVMLLQEKMELSFITEYMTVLYHNFEGSASSGNYKLSDYQEKQINL